MQKLFKFAATVGAVTLGLSLSACQTSAWNSDSGAQNAETGSYTPAYARSEMRTQGQIPESQMPSLVISEGSGPDVIYNEGSRDVVAGSKVIPQESYAYKRSNVKTLVGRKVADLAVDLKTLRNDVEAKSAYLHRLKMDSENIAEGYYALVAGMSSELQAGSTPGNPDLVDNWNDAQKRLNALAESSGELNNLATDIGSDASRAAFLLESTRATFNLSGARKEDHEKLVELEDDINETIVRIDRLLNQVNDENTRRTTYLRTERLNMQTLSHAIANGDMYGQNISNRLFRRATQAAAGKENVGPLPAMENGMVANRRPLVVIRFDRPDLDYEQALFGALSQALERRPDAQFDLVTVSPTNGNPAETALYTTAARKNGEAVLRSLTQMGVPLERVNLNSAKSNTARNSEVHLYIR